MWDDVDMRDGESRQVGRNGMIYRTGVTYSVANGGGWLPGIYADEATAEKALTIENFGALARIAHWEQRGQGDDYRPITAGDLEGL